MNNLCRVCGAPKAHAEIISHSASYPMLARSQRTRSNPAVSKPGTFSMSATLGRNSQMTRKYSVHNPLRSPARPARFPARLTSWQGNPPAITSMGARLCFPTVRTSVNLGTEGQCFVRTLLAYSSISTCHAQRIPARSSPKSKPPIPENKLPNVTSLLIGGDTTYDAPEAKAPR